MKKSLSSTGRVMARNGRSTGIAVFSVPAGDRFMLRLMKEKPLNATKKFTTDFAREASGWWTARASLSRNFPLARRVFVGGRGMLNHLKSFLVKLKFRCVHEHMEQTELSLVTGEPEVFYFSCWENGFGKRDISVHCPSVKGTENQAWRYTKFYNEVWRDWKSNRISTKEMLERMERIKP